MHRTAFWVVLIGVLLLGSVIGQDKKVYPNRWVRVRANLRDDSDVDRVRALVKTASEHGLTAIALSAGLDTLDLKPPDYFRRLKEVREICLQHKIEIVPSFMSVGYGGAVLAHDKNLAAGLPVRDALFVVSQGKAKIQADPPVRIDNGSFEAYDEKQIESFDLTGRFGESIFSDRAVFKEGRASLRIDNSGKTSRDWTRVTQAVKVHPYRCYRLTAWVKRESTEADDPFGSANFQLEVLGGGERRPLQYENPRLSRTDDWQKVSVAFNTWGYNRVEIAPKLRGAAGGKLWLDGVRLEEVGLLNIVRRPGTPLVVRSDEKGTLYEEGRDYAPVADPQLNFHWNREGPQIQILPGSRVLEGERLRVSYYNGTSIYNGQTPVCMSEPKLYEIWRAQARLVHQALAPDKYLLNMDEVRTGGSCEACKKRGLTMAQILGDCLTRQFNLLREVNSKAEIFVWSDMLDPNHNANPERKYYYLAEGTYVDSWKYIPKDLVIVCWYFEKRMPSLRHFSELGYRTMAGAYYDADTLDNPKAWLEALHGTPGACGIMYTTWLNKYALLASFGDLVSGTN